MSNSLFSDISFRTAKIALDGLSLRQQAISNNLANVDTPGFQAQTVNFEDTLKRLTAQTSSLKLKVSDQVHIASLETAPTDFTFILREGGSFRADQNNVDIDVEMVDMSEVGIQYQAVSQAISQKLILLKNLAK